MREVGVLERERRRRNATIISSGIANASSNETINRENERTRERKWSENKTITQARTVLSKDVQRFAKRKILPCAMPAGTVASIGEDGPGNIASESGSSSACFDLRSPSQPWDATGHQKPLTERSSRSKHRRSATVSQIRNGSRSHGDPCNRS